MEFEPLEVPEASLPSPSAAEPAVRFEPLVETGSSDSSTPQGAFEQGYQAGVELASAQAGALANAFAGAESARLEQMRARASRLEAEAASLACQIAANLVDAELSLRPELIVGILQGALSDVAEAEEAVVEMHPDDLALLGDNPSLSEIKLTFRPDPEISPGGCRVHSRVGDVDATREGRLEQMRARVEELSRERQ